MDFGIINSRVSFLILCILVLSFLVLSCGVENSTEFENSYISLTKRISSEGEHMRDSVTIVLSQDQNVVEAFKNDPLSVEVSELLVNMSEETLIVDYGYSYDANRVIPNKEYREYVDFYHFVIENGEVVLRTNTQILWGYDPGEIWVDDPILLFKEIPENENDNVSFKFSYKDSETGEKVFEIKIDDKLNSMIIDEIPGLVCCI